MPCTVGCGFIQNANTQVNYIDHVVCSRLKLCLVLDSQDTVAKYMEAGGDGCVSTGDPCTITSDCCDMTCVDGVCGEISVTCLLLEIDQRNWAYNDSAQYPKLSIEYTSVRNEGTRISTKSH